MYATGTMSRMTRARKTLLVVALLLAGGSVGWVLRGTGVLFPAPPGHVFELFAGTNGQSWQRTMSFLDGDFGLVLQGGVVYNHDSHLDFDHYNSGSFRVGIQGGEKGSARSDGGAAASFSAAGRYGAGWRRR